MKLPLKFHIIIEIKIPEGNPSGIIFMHMFFDEKLFPFIKPRKAKSLAISRLLAFSISIVPHNVPQILGVFEVPKNQ